MSANLRVAVVGGGVAGLSCAHALMEAAREGSRAVDVVVYEARDRLGGNIRTEHHGGFTIDAGPDSWIATKPDAAKLARSLQLGAELIGTQETNRRVYIAWDGALHLMPEGLVLGIPTDVRPIALTPLFSWDAKLRMALEPLIPPRQFLGDDDESVGDFMARRLGDQMTDRLVGPLLGGIFAGDPYAISVRAAFPQLVAAEEARGSLVRAMRASQRARAGEGGEGKARPSAFVSLRGGLGAFIDALAARVSAGARLRTSCAVRSVARAAEGSKFTLETAAGEVERFDHVALCGPMHASAAVARALDADLAASLDGLMGYTSTATVFFAFRHADVRHPLDASGYIVPRVLGRPLLAATWVSSKWEHRAPPGHVLMRAFLGGVGNEDILRHDDAELTQIALGELAAFTPFSAAPLFSRLYRFHRASPQPHVGHLGRVRRVREMAARWPGLHLAGSGFDGVGIPDCVRQGEAIARAILGPAQSRAAVQTSAP